MVCVLYVYIIIRNCNNIVRTRTVSAEILVRKTLEKSLLEQYVRNPYWSGLWWRGGGQCGVRDGSCDELWRWNVSLWRPIFQLSNGPSLTFISGLVLNHYFHPFSFGMENSWLENFIASVSLWHCSSSPNVNDTSESGLVHNFQILLEFGPPM